MKRRILSIITALALCLSLCPTWALAAEADPSLCKHHRSHTSDCGYTAPTEGHDCGHEHTAECYTLGVLPDADSGDPYEIGGDTENLLDCQHSHDSACGYVQADPGAPCGYVCRICPIEALIAALPEQVTEDNAEVVRARLDEILDLYRKLTEDEQEQIDISRCLELREALDAENASMRVASTPQKAANSEGAWLEVGTDYTYNAGDRTYDCIVVSSAANEASVVWKEVQNPYNDTLENKQEMISLCEAKGGRLIKFAEYQVLSDHQIVDANSQFVNYGCQEYAVCFYYGGTLEWQNNYSWNDWCYFIAFDLHRNPIEASESFQSEKYYDGAPFAVDTSGFTWKGEATPDIKYYSDTNGAEIPAPSAVGTYYIKLFIADQVVEDGIRYEASESEYIEIAILPIITGQPEDAELYYGYTSGSVLSVTAAAEGVTYQWYENGSAIDGATQAAYTVPTGKTVGTYRYDCEVTLGGYTEKSQTASVTVIQSGTGFPGEVKTYKGETETTSFTASDTIKVVATPTPTGAAPTNSAMFAASFTPPTTGQMAVFVDDTQVSEPVDAVDGTYTMEVSASDVLTLGGVEPNGDTITLTAKFVRNDNMADGAGTVDVNISAAARVEKDSTTTYVGALADAFTDGNSGATVTLLSEVDLGSNYIGIRGSSTFTLDLNGQTVKASHYGAFDISGGSLTIQDSGTGGKIESSNITIKVTGGTLSIKSGTVSGFYGVQITSGTVNISGGVISGTENGLWVNGGGNIVLSGGAYSGIHAILVDANVSVTLKDLLAARYAYHQNDIPVAKAEGWVDNDNIGEVPLDTKPAWLTGTVTVKECNHTGEGVCTYTHNENTSTHTKTCLACGKTWEAEDCDYGEYTHNDTSHTRICKLCGYQNVEAHNIECTAKASGTVIAVSEACETCGYGKDLGTVTIHIPKLVYGNLTGVVTAETTLTETVVVAVVVDNNSSGSTVIFPFDPPTMATLTGNALLSAGTHQIKIEIIIDRDDDNELADCLLPFTVDPAPLTPSITGTATKTYDGTADVAAGQLSVTLTGVVDDDTVTAAATSYAYDTANAGTNKTITASGITLTGADAGNYTLSSTTATTTGTITKSQPTIAFADGYNPSKTYDGQTISNPTADDLTITGAAFGNVDFTWSATPKNAGTYTLTANIKETPNTAAASTSPLTVTISKATLTATGATVASKPYDGTDTAIVSGVTFTGLVNGETLALGTDYTATGTFADANAGEGKSVTVTVTLTSDKTKNYSLAQNTTAATGTINRASSSITTAPTASGITYGQALSGSTLTGGEAVSGDTTIAGTWNWTAPTIKPNAGTAQYEVTFTPDNPNYNTAKVNVSVTVAKATPTLTAPTAGAIQYGQKLSDSTLTGGTATNPNDNATVAGTWSWANGNTQPTATGTFPVAFVPSDTANYNTPENVDTSVTVNPAEPKITLTVPAYQVAGREVKVTCTVENPHDAAFKEGIPETVTLTYQIGSGAVETLTGTSFTIPEGTAVDTVITVTASTATVDGKYTAATKTATVTVTDKIPVEISGVGVTGRAYNGKAINHTGTPVIKTLDGKTVTDATVTYTWSSGGDTGPINAGNYTLTISVDDEKYIGSTTVDFTIEKATVTITAVNKSAVVGSAQPELTYTVSGLADGETLATVPTLTCTPDMNTVGSYPITASGAAVPNTGNYNTTITYVDGTLSVTAKPSTGGGGYVPSNPGGSTLPVTTTGQGSTTTTTTTTAAPTASVNNGTATTTINTAMGNEIVRQATANKSENVVIAPSVTGNVTKAEVSIPASTVGQIGSQTNASLTVSTPVADVTIPNGGLGSLSSAGGTVTVTAEQVGSSVELTVTAGGRTIQNVPGGVTLTVPIANTTPGTVAVLVHPDGTREVVRKSMADNGTVTIPLDGSAKLEIVDNSRQFADVPATSWAADAVAFASAHELFNGTAPGQFSPNVPMSRGMLAVVLHNLESNPTQALTGAFTDVDNSQWYAEGVAWAEAQGIIGGYGNGQFGPNDNITREQLAVMLWRYAGSPAATDQELHFADADKASGWALDALRWATENGIINGKGGGILDPTGQATRAETAQMLKNFMENQ